MAAEAVLGEAGTAGTAQPGPQCGQGSAAAVPPALCGVGELRRVPSTVPSRQQRDMVNGLRKNGAVLLAEGVQERAGAY